MSSNAMDTCIAAVNQLEQWKELEADERTLSGYMSRLETNLAAVLYDAMTMALRLYAESDDTFAPETIEVMARWRPLVEAKLRGDV